VTLTNDGGGVDGNVDFGTLETIVDNYQANIKAVLHLVSRQEI